MSAFSPRSNVRNDLACLEAAAWIWSPPATFAQRFLGANAIITFFVAVAWAIFIGYLAGRLFAAAFTKGSS
jgi:hypothetical protein